VWQRVAIDTTDKDMLTVFTLSVRRKYNGIPKLEN
jgi:hypothetical protein